MFIIMMNRITARTRARTRTDVQVSIAARVRAAPAASRAREIFLAAARKTGGATRPLSCVESACTSTSSVHEDVRVIANLKTVRTGLHSRGREREDRATESSSSSSSSRTARQNGTAERQDPRRRKKSAA